jgi:hypothetical protein
MELATSRMGIFISIFILCPTSLRLVGRDFNVIRDREHTKILFRLLSALVDVVEINKNVFRVYQQKERVGGFGAEDVKHTPPMGFNAQILHLSLIK